MVEACIEGDIAAVRKLLDEGRSVHEPTDEGESLLSLACSAGKLATPLTLKYFFREEANHNKKHQRESCLVIVSVGDSSSVCLSVSLSVCKVQYVHL